MTSRTVIIDAIETLRKARCTCGNAFTGPTGEDIAAAILNGVNLAARVSGLTPEEYAEWIELTAPVSLLAASRAATR